MNHEGSLDADLEIELESAPAVERPEPIVQFLAWGVHAYTALGLVLAAGMAVLLVRGGADSIRACFGLMLIATLIDATDGTMARRIGVKKVLPQFDGRKLDDLTDFLTYTFLPLMLIWRAEILPPGAEPWLILPLLASAYGFCQVEAKTDDGYFLGFPSLWNVVAFYLVVLHLPGLASLLVVIALSVLTFVPSRYLYPSQPGRLNVVSNVLGVVWTCLLISVLAVGPAAPISSWWLAAISLFYPVFYLAASWVVTVRLWLRPTAA